MKRPTIRSLRPYGGMLAVAMLLSACGDGDSDGSAPSAPSTPITSPSPTVTVTPSATTLTASDRLNVTIVVSGGGSGSVVLTSGAYGSAVVPLSNGQASIAVPAGVLAIGSDVLTATFQPSSGTSSTGQATVSVSPATTPSVTASSSLLQTFGHPFSALPIDGGLLVSVTSNGNANSQTGLRVFTGTTPAGLTSSCLQPVAFPDASGNTSAFGLSATPNGAGLAVAVEDAGIALLARGATGGCTATPVQVSQGSLASGQGSFDVAVTPDGRYAFVANEYGVAGTDSSGANINGNVGVIALTYDASGAPTGGQLVGQIGTGGQAIAGITLSPDGSRLYVTSEITRSGTTVSGTGNAILAHGGCTQASGSPSTSYGTLSIIDVAKAEAAPGAGAIVGTVASGCSPVRSVVSADGEVLWVAVRGDNRVLAFSTRSLERSPDNALLGYADTGGTAPVGLALFGGGKLLAVANSNRFASPAATGSLTILQAVPVRPVLLQTVAAGYFPRNVSVAADDSTLFLTNYNGGSVQVIATSVH